MITPHFDQGREKTVCPIEKFQPLDCVRAVDFQAAGRIIDIILADPVANLVGLSRLPSSEWCVLTILSPAGDHVIFRMFFHHFDQTGDFFRIILQIGIDGGDELSTGGFKSCFKSGTLTGVSSHSNHPKPRQTGFGFCQKPGSIIRTPIVHDDHFKRFADLLKG